MAAAGRSEPRGTSEGNSAAENRAPAAKARGKGTTAWNQLQELILRVPEALPALGSLFRGSLPAQQTYFLTKNKGCREVTARRRRCPGSSRGQGARWPGPRRFGPQPPSSPAGGDAPEEPPLHWAASETRALSRNSRRPGQHAPRLERDPGSSRAALTWAPERGSRLSFGCGAGTAILFILVIVKWIGEMSYFIVVCISLMLSGCWIPFHIPVIYLYVFGKVFTHFLCPFFFFCPDLLRNNWNKSQIVSSAYFVIMLFDFVLLNFSNYILRILTLTQIYRYYTESTGKQNRNRQVGQHQTFLLSKENH